MSIWLYWVSWTSGSYKQHPFIVLKSVRKIPAFIFWMALPQISLGFFYLKYLYDAFLISHRMLIVHMKSRMISATEWKFSISVFRIFQSSPSTKSPPVATPKKLATMWFEQLAQLWCWEQWHDIAQLAWVKQQKEKIMLWKLVNTDLCLVLNEYGSFSLCAKIINEQYVQCRDKSLL